MTMLIIPEIHEALSISVLTGKKGPDHPQTRSPTSNISEHH